MKDLSGLRVAAYARYSSEMQNEGSIDAQFLLIKRHVESNGGKWSDVERFSDAAESGSSLDRPAVQRLLSRVKGRKKQYDAILVESIDRLSRTVSDTARLCDDFDFADVRLIAVSEGIDTADPNARLMLHLKASLAQQLLREVAAKTRRGLHGQAAKGFCTGGLPYGYASKPNPNGKFKNSAIEIDIDQAAIVRRVFSLWIAGHSCLDIAGILNADHVPTPRSRTAKRGWVDTTVRAMLRNEAYIGEWKFGSKRWLKVPGTKKRQYRDAPDEEVQYFARPELRIIDDRTWKAAQDRIEQVAGKYKGRNQAAPVRKTNYPLSGILHCGLCGGPMSIIGGSSAKYYRCTDSHKRKTCPKCHPLREDQIAEAVIGLVKKQIGSPVALAYLHEQLKRHAATRNKHQADLAKPLNASLRKVQQKVDNLVASVASGELSGVALGPVQKALEEAEGQRRVLETKVRALEAAAEQVVATPTHKHLASKAKSMVEDLDALLRKDATEAREVLRKFFHDGKIIMHPTEDGGWRAESRFYPAIILNKPQKRSGPGGESGAVYFSSCAGWI